jgi:hypothetical protein
MTKNITTSLIALWFLIPASLVASEARVNAAGGLSLVMDDETVLINPFTFGNPAGLSLLPPQSRFDVAGPWFQETPAANAAFQSQAYGTLSQIGSNFSTSSLLDNTNSAFQYQGLILFPISQWAFQASGDLLHATNQLDPVFTLEKSADRTRGLARTAYNFGPFSLGTEIQLNQTNKDFPSPTNGGPDGQGNNNLMTSTSGLLLNFQLDNSKTPAYLRLGGNFQTQIPPAQEKDHFSLTVSGNPLDLDYIFQSQSYISFGPELYLDVPDVFQATVVTRFSQSTVNAEVDSSNQVLFPGTPSFKADNVNNSLVFCVLKGKLPLAGTLRQRLTMNPGAYVLLGSSQSTSYDPAGNTTQTGNLTDIKTGVGIGVENPKDFTVGLQASLESQSGSSNPTGSTNPISYFSYVVSAGGEKWMNPHWAFRTGLTFEDDYDGGSTFIQKPFYALGPTNRVILTTLSAGLGFEDSGLRSDLMVSTGQPSLFDSSNPDDFATQVGLELSASILFN